MVSVSNHEAARAAGRTAPSWFDKAHHEGYFDTVHAFETHHGKSSTETVGRLYQQRRLSGLA
jgi:hypothetical protein